MIDYVPHEVAEQFGDDWQTRLAGELLSGNLPLNAHSNALAASITAKAGPGILFGFTVLNTNAAAQFVQVFDLQTLPADGAVPDFVIRITATSDRTVGFLLPGRVFTRGIILCNSSTSSTKTIGAADCFFDVQYV